MITLKSQGVNRPIEPRSQPCPISTVPSCNVTDAFASRVGEVAARKDFLATQDQAKHAPQNTSARGEPISAVPLENAEVTPCIDGRQISCNCTRRPWNTIK